MRIMQYLVFMSFAIMIGCSDMESFPSTNFTVKEAVASPDGGTVSITVEDSSTVYYLGNYKPKGGDKFKCYIRLGDEIIYQSKSNTPTEDKLLKLLLKWMKKHTSPENIKKIFSEENSSTPLNLPKDVNTIYSLYRRCISN